MGRLDAARRTVLGDAWCDSWQQGLPRWDQTPGHINLPLLLWLHGLVEAWGMEGYARARYGLLGQASHWFPGANADGLDGAVSEASLMQALEESPWAEQIPDLLRHLRARVGGAVQHRLSST